MIEIPFQHLCFHCGEPVMITDNHAVMCGSLVCSRQVSNRILLVSEHDLEPCQRCCYPAYFILQQKSYANNRYLKKICSNVNCQFWQVNIYKDFFMIFYRDIPMFELKKGSNVLYIQNKPVKLQLDSNPCRFIQSLLAAHSEGNSSLQDYL